MAAEQERWTILLVHPDPVVHELVSGTLGDEFQVISAPTGARAMTLFERHEPAVVVLDSDVGDQKAEDMFERMRARVPALRAVFLVDQDDPARAFRLAEIGTVLPKRHDIERLRVAVRNAARFRAMSENVAKLRTDTGRASPTGPRADAEEAPPHSGGPRPMAPTIPGVGPSRPPPRRGRR